MTNVLDSVAPRAHFVASAPACAPGCPHAGTGGEGAGCAFQVAWQINPHMRVGAAEPREAARQHEAFVRHVRRLGATVDLLPFVHGAYDSVFAKDGAILVHRGGVGEALVAQPLHPERQGEQRARRTALEARGFRVTDAPATPLEGGDVVLGPTRRGAGAYVGHGFRSARSSAGALARFLDLPVLPLELRDPRIYHLDMALASLGDTLFVHEEAFTPRSMQDLVQAAGAGRIVRVSAAEALGFALNFVAIGRDVVLARGAPAFERRLSALGFFPHALPLSQFHLAGGSAACLVAKIHPLDRVAVSTTAAIRSTAA